MAALAILYRGRCSGILCEVANQGYPNLKTLAQRAAEHPINKTDKKVQKLSASPRNFSTSRNNPG